MGVEAGQLQKLLSDERIAERKFCAAAVCSYCADGFTQLTRLRKDFYVHDMTLRAQSGTDKQIRQDCAASKIWERSFVVPKLPD